MPWKETCTMNERELFINAWLDRAYSVSQLCHRFGISRKTGHKWINRFKAEGMTGLADRSRARLKQSHRTPEAVVEKILQLKHNHPDWGPETITSALYRAQPDHKWPAISTVGTILKHHGLVKPRRKRHKVPPQSQPLAHATAPGKVWSADFKGQFKLGNGQTCYPLTISDNYSRLLISCQGQTHLRTGFSPQFPQLDLPGRRKPGVRTSSARPISRRGR